MKDNEARVQVDIGVQVNPRQKQTISADIAPLYWIYVIVGLLTLETLAAIYLLGWH